MKANKPKEIRYPAIEGKALSLKEDLSMVRTQVYLTRAEHEFLQAEAERAGEPMSAFLRRIVDEKMRMPEEAWQNNPMLAATPEIQGWNGHEDAAENHDAYIYGSPTEN
jgi:hypothetical protein